MTFSYELKKPTDEIKGYLPFAIQAVFRYFCT